MSGCKQIKKGQTVTILETVTGWYKLQYGAYTGYVRADYREDHHLRRHGRRGDLHQV